MAASLVIAAIAAYARQHRRLLAWTPKRDAVPSLSVPAPVGSLAEQVARVGRLPLIDALGVSGPPPTAEAASAVRARDLLARTSVRDGVSFDGPVLLVDDTVRTRWTVTVASALLAEAGASHVMPLAVHLLP